MCNSEISREHLYVEINCAQCGSLVRDAIDMPRDLICNACKTSGGRITAIQGYIYVLQNEIFPELLKIGFTSRALEQRVREINSATGVPNPFLLLSYFESCDPMSDESAAHHALDLYRENKSREFFRISHSEAICAIERVLGLKHIKVRDPLVSSPESQSKEPILKSRFYCSSCHSYKNSPSMSEISKYATYWRDRLCPDCGTGLVLR